MFYAFFGEIGLTEITAFKTKRERDDWVDYKDEFSKALKISKSNSTFKRCSVEAEVAEEAISSRRMLPQPDGVNEEQVWYVTP